MGGKGEERRKRLLLVLFEEIDFEGLLDQEKSCLVFWMLVLIIRRRGGGIVQSSYIHMALRLMGTGKLEKRLKLNCSAGVTILTLLQHYFSFTRQPTGSNNFEGPF